MNNVKFTSVLAPYMVQVIKSMQASEKKVEQIIYNFKELDTFANRSGLKDSFITESWVKSWKSSRLNDSETTLYLKYVSLIRLLKHMSRRGQVCFIPQLPCFPKSNFTPYVFTEEEMTAIFKTLDCWMEKKKNIRSGIISLPTLIRLLYSSGLRISEAISIKNNDVDLNQGTISIRKTKNVCERIISLSESMISTIRIYTMYRDKMPIKGINAPDAPLFVKLDGMPLRRFSVLCAFQKVLRVSEIKYRGRDHGPCVHSLRHTYANHSLLQMWKSGMDLYASLPLLSISLGHKSLTSTEKYLHLLKMYYPEIEQSTSTLNLQIFPSKKQYED